MKYGEIGNNGTWGQGQRDSDSLGHCYYYVNLCRLTVFTGSEVAFLSCRSVETIRSCSTRHADQDQMTVQEAVSPYLNRLWVSARFPERRGGTPLFSPLSYATYTRLNLVVKLVNLD